MFRENIKLIMIVSLIIASSAFAQISVVKYLDAKRFSGVWYEIARTYNSFEDGCIAPSIEYELVSEDRLKVYNRCFEEKIGGEIREYRGSVQIDNEIITKTYFKIFSKDYHLIYLDNYQTAIMSDKALDNVWIMHRKPHMKPKKLQYLTSYLKQCIDTSKLIYPKQDKNGRYK